MNYIAMHQWLEALGAQLEKKGATIQWIDICAERLRHESGRYWVVKIGIIEDKEGYRSERIYTSPEDALIAANEWVANWLHPDKRLALVLGIETEPHEEPDIAQANDSTLIPF